MKTSFYLKPIANITVSLVITIVLFILEGCTTDIAMLGDNEQKVNKKSPISSNDTTHLQIDALVDENSFDAPNSKKALQLSLTSKAVQSRALAIGQNGKIEKNQDFEAICYIMNPKLHKLGRFTLNWKTKEESIQVTEKGKRIIKKQLKLDGKRTRTVVITWLYNGKPSKIEGGDWKVCAIAGGGKQISKGGNKLEAISFEPEVVNNQRKNEGLVVIPFISEYTPILINPTSKMPQLRFKFNMAGTLLKIKLKCNDEVSKDREFFFKTTGIDPRGEFWLQNLTPQYPKDDSIRTMWVKARPSTPQSPNTDLDVYNTILRADDAQELKIGRDKYFLWYIWGMPNTERSFHETIMGAMNGGYIIKNVKKQGPLWTSYNFKNDYGKLKTFNLAIHAPEAFPSFFFLNVLERVAEHNLKAPKTWWESDDKVKPIRNKFSKQYVPDKSVFFTYDQAVNPDNMPKGYHLPSIDEMTILFPYEGNNDSAGKDFRWDKDFTNPNSSWTEWLTLYAIQLTHEERSNPSKKMWVVCDNATSGKFNTFHGETGKVIQTAFQERNIKGFNSYIYNPNGGDIFYSVRFAENPIYHNKIRCAYRWDFRNVGWVKNGNDTERQMIVTSRWIGDAPLTVKDIANEQWWSKNNKYDVVRKLPAQGEVTKKGTHNIGIAGSYMCSGMYDFGTFSNGNFVRSFNKEYGKTIQRKSYGVDVGLVRPFRNLMMCNEKSKDGGNTFYEENTGKGTGQILDMNP